jgi:TolB-like protein/tetratricopeptide (TPR) repeat protein
MAEARVERRLAAILAADVAGYSRLMGVDEEGTLAALKAYRRELIDPKIAEHRGRIVKTTGDGALVEFASAVDATRCAMEIQRVMAERNATVPEDHRIEFRIGINVGDIILDEGDIYGDGVNIAARIETLAKPGSICISDNAYRQIKGKLALEVNDMGEQPLKNIAEPVRVYMVAEKPSARAPLALPDKPSIAVLPFQNMSGDPEQEYFADGMAEEILTALSRCKWLFVIARNSSFTYKGKAVDIRQVGRELGVRYVLEGSVRRGGNRLRFTGQLIDAISGAHIWGDRFEGELSDVFELQDRITESVVATIEPKIQLAEIERLKNKPAANLDAYDLLLRAQQLEYEFTEESVLSALRCAQEALVIDPSYAPAMAMAAYCYGERRFQGWTREIEKETAEGLRLAKQALQLASDDANVLWMAALTTWQLGLDIQNAKELAYRSLETNPNSAIASTIAGWIEAYSGNSAKGMELLRRAQRLSPLDPRAWFNAAGMSISYLGEGQFEEGASWAKKALAKNPRYTVAMRLLAAHLAQLKQLEPAREAIKEMFKVEPHLTLSVLRSRLMFMHDRVWKNLSTGLRIAGMPE